MFLQGAFPSQYIRLMIEEQIIEHGDCHAVQPSSLDLTITDEVYRMKGVFLPRHGETIKSIIADGAIYKYDLTNPLECGAVYLVKLQERLKLPPEIYAYANNKSSSGRINLQVRLIADGVSQFDNISPGYHGDLWLVISPKSFSVKLYAGDRLNQIRFYNTDARLSAAEYEAADAVVGLLRNKTGERLNEKIWGGNLKSIPMTIDLEQDLIGFSCTPSPGKVLDFHRYDHDPNDFFNPIYRLHNHGLVLNHNEFYILSTAEYIRVPLEFAVEMVAYDTSKGEFRSHYAGFFDPGWGFGEHGEVMGAPAVLEVITQDNEFYLRHGQPICKMVYERLAEKAELSYGSSKAESHYHEQRGPRLSKHFRNPAL